MGYAWRPVIRIVPQDGAPRGFDLKTALTDAGGPNRVKLSYPFVASQREDANRRLAPTAFGYRPEVELTMDLVTLADQYAIAEILDALRDRDRARVTLSLDGGYTERDVVLDGSPKGPDGLGGKTVGGASFGLKLRAVDLIASPPAMFPAALPAPRELIPNGGMENWDGVLAPPQFPNGKPIGGWFVSISAGSVVTQEGNPTFVHTGSFSFKHLDDASGTYEQLAYNFPAQSFAPGKSYRISMWILASQTTGVNNQSTFRNLRLDALDLGGWLRNDGSMSTSGATTDRWGAYAAKSVPTAWTLETLDFLIPPTFFFADIYRWETPFYNVAGAAIWIDDISLVGPIVPAGVARW
ncbi:MAG TPA: hypothetical protein VJL07_05700 [Dehalococcoidia bacterium]|nr:hypothetical protein [Dehalococcoidia bacterium]